MQPVLNTTNYSDLYEFLHALVFETNSNKHSHLDSIVIWSPEASSSLFDSRDKLDMVEHYARKLNVSVSLSAASDSVLREWGNEIGWQVLWEMPGLDNSPYANSHSYNIISESDAALAS